MQFGPSFTATNQIPKLSLFNPNRFIIRKSLVIAICDASTSPGTSAYAYTCNIYMTFLIYNSMNFNLAVFNNLCAF